MHVCISVQAEAYRSHHTHAITILIEGDDLHNQIVGDIQNDLDIPAHAVAVRRYEDNSC